MHNMSLNQPLYLYQTPMFMLTVSTVILVDNGTILISESLGDGEEETCRFPGGQVKAGQETIQFAAVRYVKEQTGISIKKDDLIPIDFRSNPERSKEKNVVDFGMLCLMDESILHNELILHKLSLNAKWNIIDYDNKCLTDQGGYICNTFYMDHALLLERAIDAFLMMRDY